MSLTDAKLRNAKSQVKPFKLSDEKGLFLLVTPSGGRWWRFKYRFAGKEKSLSLSTFVNSCFNSIARENSAMRL
ncbi:Arm DNA-binding domain-containing protein [Mucilaginibacter sp.]|uniref:Arm DNA-binding domain-containing protein n=1 Tax=Mucilaginibacter sp. TaxID=1882438 RepID=UPI00344D2548